MNHFKILAVVLKLAASVALLWFALSGFDMAALVARAGSILPLWLAIAFTICLLQSALIAERWRVICRFCGIELTWRRAFQLVMIGNFFNQVLPSSLGGDAIRLWLVGRQSGWRETTYSILIDRGFGLLAICGIIVATWPLSFGHINDSALRVSLIAAGGGGLFAGFCFVASGFAAWPLLDGLPLLRKLHDCAKIAARVVRSSGSGSLVVSVSLLIHVIAIATTYALAQAIGARVTLMDLFMLLPPVMLIAAFPISIAGWGIREFSMVAAFGFFGLAQTDGLVISLLTGLVQLATGVMGGVMWVAFKMSPKRTLEAKAGPLAGPSETAS
ncbi:lysylphosphatidylglycerol synthase transmembrane domain-containing protein [Nitrobacter sp. TKz-YC02]|uniref:lysylphosphatidylglycerol synthase transmembrane domain-containing protein n=1 Tax=Nitrobacter sp. TKz-YC02 TaxID=3398704 RepID=UPI003CF61E1A